MAQSRPRRGVVGDERQRQTAGAAGAEQGRAALMDQALRKRWRVSVDNVEANWCAGQMGRDRPVHRAAVGGDMLCGRDWVADQVPWILRSWFVSSTGRASLVCE